jgi:hypothetical protein
MKTISAKQREDGYYDIEVIDISPDGTPVTSRYPKAMINITVYAERDGETMAQFTFEE